MADAPALRIVARGISCSDCIWFGRDADGYPQCDAAHFTFPTRETRMDESLCGPDARWFLKDDGDA